MTKEFKPDRPVAKYDPPMAFIEALTRGAIVEMYDGPLNAPHLAFRLKGSGGAIHVVTPEGEIVGVFATATAAAVYGFQRIDRLSRGRSPARKRTKQARTDSRERK